METSQRIADTVLLALAQAADLPAQGQGTMNNARDRRAALDVLRDARRRPGRVEPRRPGPSGVHVGMSNTLNTPIEALELELPLRIERYELLRGTGGDGRPAAATGSSARCARSRPARSRCSPSAVGTRRTASRAASPDTPGRNLVNGERCPPRDEWSSHRRCRHGRDPRRRRLGRRIGRVTWVGQPLPRREDLPLLTGRGRFVDDVQVANPLHVAFARSPWAHAEIRSVDLTDALAAPGVAAALAGSELPGLTDPFAAGITYELGYYAMAGRPGAVRGRGGGGDRRRVSLPRRGRRRARRR